ncbi:adenosylcobinamide amidohydrolase [Saccharothrix sp. NPDC042600]|uniref:adenosylcobinamide amidohydrolase n=1 Tax=Saccharothrix TaxID=2071 RepID=UPI0033F9EB23
MLVLEPEVWAQPGVGRPALVWRFPVEVRAVSTAVVGGGLGGCRWVLNVEVHDEYHRDPVEHLNSLAGERRLEGPGVGLLTAARVLRYTTGADDGVECVTTVGLTHPVNAARPVPLSEEPTRFTAGTINTVCWVPAPLDDSALVNAVVTATEAKAQALRDTGFDATGTPSDAVVVCAEPGGGERYGGPRSRWGARLANAVYEATARGAAAWTAG